MFVFALASAGTSFAGKGDAVPLEDWVVMEDISSPGRIRTLTKLEDGSEEIRCYDFPSEGVNKDYGCEYFIGEYDCYGGLSTIDWR